MSTHYKVLAMLGRLDHGSPLVYATEFDSQKAAEAAAAWLHDNGGFQTTVITDPEWDEADEDEEAVTEPEVIASDRGADRARADVNPAPEVAA